MLQRPALQRQIAVETAFAASLVRVCPQYTKRRWPLLGQLHPGVMAYAGGAGTFFTEPQHAPSMKATFGKLYVQGFRSLQKILTATALSRNQSDSEASEVDCSGACSYPHLD